MKDKIREGIGLTIISWLATIVFYYIGDSFEKIPLMIYVCDFIFPVVTLLLTIKYYYDSN